MQLPAQIVPAFSITSAKGNDVYTKYVCKADSSVLYLTANHSGLKRYQGADYKPMVFADFYKTGPKPVFLRATDEGGTLHFTDLTRRAEYSHYTALLMGPDSMAFRWDEAPSGQVSVFYRADLDYKFDFTTYQAKSARSVYKRNNAFCKTMFPDTVYNELCYFDLKIKTGKRQRDEKLVYIIDSAAFSQSTFWKHLPQGYTATDIKTGLNYLGALDSFNITAGKGFPLVPAMFKLSSKVYNNFFAVISFDGFICDSIDTDIYTGYLVLNVQEPKALKLNDVVKKEDYPLLLDALVNKGFEWVKKWNYYIDESNFYLSENALVLTLITDDTRADVPIQHNVYIEYDKIKSFILPNSPLRRYLDSF